MPAFKQIFNMLPKEVEDKIYRYNADHRELMQPVLSNIQHHKKNTCMHCHYPIHNKLYILHDMDFCSVACYEEIERVYGDHYYNPYIEVLMYGNNYYNKESSEYFMNMIDDTTD